jgi:cytochrome c oxidase subunit 2
VAVAASQSTLEPASDAARTIADLWWLLFAVSAVVFAVVLALVVLAVLRRRSRGAGTGRPLVLVGGVAVPAVVLVALFALTVATLPGVSAPTGETALTIEVKGRQWFWEVRYPGRGVVTANEIHLPLGTPVELRVRTGDVVHSFWVPRLNRKIDMIPGRVNSIELETDREGVYRGQCAEFCGLQHANMAFEIVAEPPARFERWLAVQAEPAREAEGFALFEEYGCGGCHTIRGTSADGVAGPDLTHVASRRTLAAGTLENTRGDLAAWVLDPQEHKPGNKMPAIEIPPDDFRELLAYLESLE